MKRFVSFLILVCICIIGSAQEQPGRFTIQPKVGINISDFADDSEAKKKVGLAAGLEAEYQLTETFSFAGGVMYSMQGAKGYYYTFESFSSSNGAITYYYDWLKYDAKINLHYITLPFVINAYLMKGFAFKFGFQFGIEASTDLTIDGKTVNSDIVDMNTFDFSIPVGVSYEFKNFVLDGRYNIGVTKVAKDTDARNSVFQITLGYKFDI